MLPRAVLRIASHPPQAPVRFASLNSAVNQGIRKSRAASTNREGDTSRSSTSKRLDEPQWPWQNTEYLDELDKPPLSRAAQRRDREELPVHIQDLKKKPPPWYRPVPEKPPIKKSLVPPKRIPFSSPSSEFLYGSSAVMAALRCNRRKMYVLYIYESEDEFITRMDSRVHILDSVRKFALAAGVKVKNVTGKWVKLLDQMSHGRPHNGVVLEASRLPKLPVEAFEPVLATTATHFSSIVVRQPADEAVVNGTDGRIPRFSYTHQSNYLVQEPEKRFPFVLVLEGITDQGNLGAILRSAYYFGVDAVVLTRNTAPVSAVAIKASAGAAENLPLLSVTNPTAFVDRSRAAGWRFFAADAPASESDDTAAVDEPDQQPAEPPSSSWPSSAQHQPSVSPPLDPSSPALPLRALAGHLKTSPCALMLGSEDRGLAPKLLRRADSTVAIRSALTDSRAEDDGAAVDSLNVSVAAALLCEAFLGSSSTVQRQAEGGSSVIGMVEKMKRADGNKLEEDDGNRVF